MPKSLGLEPMLLSTGMTYKVVAGGELPAMSVAIQDGHGKKLTGAFFGGKQQKFRLQQRVTFLSAVGEQGAKHPEPQHVSALFSSCPLLMPVTIFFPFLIYPASSHLFNPESSWGMTVVRRWNGLRPGHLAFVHRIDRCKDRRILCSRAGATGVGL